MEARDGTAASYAPSSAKILEDGGFFAARADAFEMAQGLGFVTLAATSALAVAALGFGAVTVEPFVVGAFLAAAFPTAHVFMEARGLARANREAADYQSAGQWRRQKTVASWPSGRVLTAASRGNWILKLVGFSDLSTRGRW